ncbi:MAG: hypothetical protein E6K72_03110, partial [Candidatus Eisenbacteria bacterium]
MPDRAQRSIQRAARAQRAYRDQDRDQIRHDADRNVEAFLGALDEGLVERDPAPRAGSEKQHDDAEQESVGEQAGLAADRIC